MRWITQVFESGVIRSSTQCLPSTCYLQLVTNSSRNFHNGHRHNTQISTLLSLAASQCHCGINHRHNPQTSTLPSFAASRSHFDIDHHHYTQTSTLLSLAASRRYPSSRQLLSVFHLAPDIGTQVRIAFTHPYLLCLSPQIRNAVNSVSMLFLFMTTSPSSPDFRCFRCRSLPYLRRASPNVPIPVPYCVVELLLEV